MKKSQKILSDLVIKGNILGGMNPTDLSTVADMYAGKINLHDASKASTYMEDIKERKVIPCIKALSSPMGSLVNPMGGIDFVYTQLDFIDDIASVLYMMMSGVNVVINIDSLHTKERNIESFKKEKKESHVINPFYEDIFNSTRILLNDLYWGKGLTKIVYDKVDPKMAKYLKTLHDYYISVFEYSKSKEEISEIEIYDMLCVTAAMTRALGYSSDLTINCAHDDAFLLNLKKDIPCKIVSTKPHEGDFLVEIGLLGKQKVNDNLYKNTNTTLVRMTEEQLAELKSSKKVSQWLTHNHRFVPTIQCVTGDKEIIKELLGMGNVVIVKDWGYYHKLGHIMDLGEYASMATINVDAINNQQHSLDKAVISADFIAEAQIPEYLNCCGHLLVKPKHYVSLSHIFNNSFSELKLKTPVMSEPTISLLSSSAAFGNINIGTLPQARKYHIENVYFKSGSLLSTLQKEHPNLVKTENNTDYIRLPFIGDYSIEEWEITKVKKLINRYSKWHNSLPLYMFGMDDEFIDEYINNDSVGCLLLYNQKSKIISLYDGDFKELEEYIENLDFGNL